MSILNWIGFIAACLVGAIALLCLAASLLAGDLVPDPDDDEERAS